ncbi:DUF5753 domain-containing protein [Streptomyces sp. NPDC126933]|uniref:DUF5753 domain-containing protein n=1 Tax=unclassified Streptomyces TaxID=2593676 RepID=UPI003655E83C
MALLNDDSFDALLEGTSLGAQGARQLRARTPAFRARAAREMPSWWHRYSDMPPNIFTMYFVLESAASRIRVYEPHCMPGLLQTEAHARAVIGLGPRNVSERVIDQQVALRMERQKRFFSGNVQKLGIVFDEVAVWRPYGSREVMRGQIHHLIDMSEWENVELQIRPFATDRHARGSRAFAILSFPEADQSDLVYREDFADALYTDRRSDVAQYELAMIKMRRDSLGPDGSRELLRDLLQRM